MVSEQQASAPHDGTWLLADSHLKLSRPIWGKVPPVLICCRYKDKKGPAKADRSIWSSHAAVQGMSSCKTWETWGLPETPISSHCPHPGERHEITTPTWCCSWSDRAWLLTRLLLASHSSKHMLLPCTSPGTLLVLLSQPRSFHWTSSKLFQKKN